MNWKKSKHLRRYVDLYHIAEDYYQDHKKEIDDAFDDYERYKRQTKGSK